MQFTIYNYQFTIITTSTDLRPSSFKALSACEKTSAWQKAIDLFEQMTIRAHVSDVPDVSDVSRVTPDPVSHLPKFFRKIEVIWSDFLSLCHFVFSLRFQCPGHSLRE